MRVTEFIFVILIFVLVSGIIFGKKSSSGVFSAISANQHFSHKEIVDRLNKAIKKNDFEQSSIYNALLANEAFRRSYKTLEAWRKEIVPHINLIPKEIFSHKRNYFWNAKDTAADNWPYLFLASYLLDKNNLSVWEGMFDSERRICGKMPCTIYFNPVGIARDSDADIIFGASEYVKDGLLIIMDYLNDGQWKARAKEIIDGIIVQSSVVTPYGNIPSTLTEVNGNLLQSLSRLYWLTGKEKYLVMAERIADAYFFDILPHNYGLPPIQWNYNNQSKKSSFILRDHGNEIIPGLTELYFLERKLNREKAKSYRQPLISLLNLLLCINHNTGGLWFSKLDPKTLNIEDARLVDTWGYLLNSYETFDLAEGSSLYDDEIKRIIGSVISAKLFNPKWEVSLADSYADSIESMLYLLPSFNFENNSFWVDNEIEKMFNMQSYSGFVSGNYLDGNFIRTALMYGLYKTQGLAAEPWSEQLFLGSYKDKSNNALYIYFGAKESWQGNLKFDSARHKNFWKMPLNYPRLNTFPQWFSIDPTKIYSLANLKDNSQIFYTGDQLIKGISFSLNADTPELYLKITEK